MVSLTPAAIEKIKSILSERKEAAGLKIGVTGSGCSGFQYKMTLAREPGIDDKVLDVEGLKLFIDRHSLFYLNGTSIDFIDGKNGTGFKFENPNPPASCGCRETFEA
jgi:iron-sulfur cluster assembly protein